MKNVLRGLLVASTLAAGLVTTTVPASAAGYCEASGVVFYRFTNVSESRKASNLVSDYLQGPGSVSYSRSTTATVSATMSTTVAAEASAVFAKASVSVGVSVGASWSRGDTWTYTMSVPSGKTARMVMYHSTRRFTVEKYKTITNSVGVGCGSSLIYSSPVDAPVTTNSNIWLLQYA